MLCSDFINTKALQISVFSVSTKCSTTHISVLLTSAIILIKYLIINVCNKFYAHHAFNYFLSVIGSFRQTTICLGSVQFNR